MEKNNHEYGETLIHLGSAPSIKIFKAMEKAMIQGGYRKIVSVGIGARSASLIDTHNEKFGQFKRCWITDHNKYEVLFVREIPAEEQEQEEQGEDVNIYRRRIIERLDQQIDKGKSKYGYQLQDNVELTFKERTEHLSEELTDGLQYIEHLKELRRNETDKLLDILTAFTMFGAKVENKNREEYIDIIRKLNTVIGEMVGYVRK